MKDDRSPQTLITALPDSARMAERTQVEKALSETTDMIRAETLVFDAVRDLVRDEVKKYIVGKLDENPELKKEIKAAVQDLMEAKIREGYAMVKLAKAGAKLGLELVPDKMRDEFMRDFVLMFQKEIGEILDKTL